MKMICFPHAGGFSNYYNFLRNASFPGVNEVILYEYPLRGVKAGKKNFTVFAEAVNYISEEIKTIVEDNDYVFFGHSYGAFIAYEVAANLQVLYGKSPYYMFISGQKPPLKVDPDHYKCCENEGMDFLKKLGGFPEYFKDYSDAMEYFKELCMSDIRILQTYNVDKEVPEERIVPQGSVLCGTHDLEVCFSDLIYWKKYFDKLDSIKLFEGNHFYMENKKEELIDFMCDCLNKKKKELIYV